MTDMLLTYGFFSLTTFVYLFAAYIITMALHERYVGTKYEWVFKIFVGLPFVLFDAFVNIFIVSTWFLERPREWLVTSRLKRWRKSYEDKSYNDLNSRQQRRLLFAVWLCDKHLDHYDKITGNHC